MMNKVVYYMHYKPSRPLQHVVSQHIVSQRDWLLGTVHLCIRCENGAARASHFQLFYNLAYEERSHEAGLAVAYVGGVVFFSWSSSLETQLANLTAKNRYNYRNKSRKSKSYKTSFVAKITLWKQNKENWNLSTHATQQTMTRIDKIWNIRTSSTDFVAENVTLDAKVAKLEAKLSKAINNILSYYRFSKCPRFYGVVKNMMYLSILYLSGTRKPEKNREIMMMAGKYA